MVRRGEERGPTAGEGLTFYTVTDEGFYLGAVGMVNSLRLMGYTNPIVVLERGLSESQRASLEAECEIVSLPDAEVTNPALLKPFGRLLNPGGIVVSIDSDMIVTSRLDAAIEAARSGQICAYPDMEAGRWFAEWERIFELPRRPRHQTYVNSGLVAFSVDHWPELLPRWWDLCRRLWTHPTIYEGAKKENPTSQADQDALNALLMSEVPERSLTILPRDEQPNTRQLRYRVDLVDVEDLSCSLGSRPVSIIHFTGRPKPWVYRGWHWRGRNPYPRLLRRLLVGGDVSVQTCRGDIPVLWLRPGNIGAAMMRVLSSVNGLDSVREWPPFKKTFKFVKGELGTRRRRWPPR